MEMDRVHKESGVLRAMQVLALVVLSFGLFGPGFAKAG